MNELRKKVSSTDFKNYSISENKPLLCFAIVVYKEFFYETKAFLSLVKSLSESNLYAHIFIYDNTDVNEWNITKTDLIQNIHVHYYRDRKNSGISVAYNYMANRAIQEGAQWIVFLDQDTALPVEAIEKYTKAIKTSPHSLVKAPVLVVDQQIFSPFRIFLKRSIKLKNVIPGQFPLKNYAFVNSGMMVKLSLFFEVGGYDERVKLDFADFLFIDRLKAKVSLVQILDFSCNHDFSHNEISIAKALNRYAIFINDLSNCPKLTLKERFEYFLVGLFHTAKLTIKFKSLQFCSIWIKRMQSKQIVTSNAIQ